MKNCGSGASNKIKTRLACILEASESTRLRMGEFLPNQHEDHIAGKGDNSPQHVNFGSQIHSYASSHKKCPQQRQQRTRNGKKWRTFRRLTNVRSKKVVIDEARTKGAKVYFASLMMDLCHLKNSELEPQYQKTQRSSCTLRR